MHIFLARITPIYTSKSVSRFKIVKLEINFTLEGNSKVTASQMPKLRLRDISRHFQIMIFKRQTILLIKKQLILFKMAMSHSSIQIQKRIFSHKITNWILASKPSQISDTNFAAILKFQISLGSGRMATVKYSLLRVVKVSGRYTRVEATSTHFQWWKV